MREMRGQFTQVFRTREGRKFYGEIGLPIERTTPSDFRPRRLITVSSKALVKTGDVVSGAGGTYLVSLQNNMADTRQFKAFEITHQLAWTRMGEEIDFVTGMPRDSRQIILDSELPVVIEYGKVVKDMDMDTDQYRVLTGADVRVGDRLGAWIVQNKREALGLSLLEIA